MSTSPNDRFAEKGLNACRGIAMGLSIEIIAASVIVVAARLLT
ncbi:hypothetical protein [Chelatococcus reniformis]|uniref:Uncharacterized protein n=1 Tax=Chelatococcus reniformis TaxID=1494448 RepID=A0A916XBW3_9HYPH|nr:hypothetical protein [Chelatococcus reniformis]GGC60369.1 hypothetical protein GCM10010994_18750 [Chelatococcus reniformis]